MATWTELTDSFANDQQIDEMRKKYENCYLFVKSQGKEPILCIYKGFDGDFHRFQDMHSMELRLRHDTSTEVMCVHPDKGLFNTERRMYYYAKLPNRQYRRGVCKDNCFITDPVYSLWNQDKNMFSGSLLSFAYKNQFYDIETALERLRKKDAVSVAIDINFGVSMSVTADSSQVFLWYHDTCIGQITSKNVVVVKNEFFSQEVLDNIKLFQPFKVEFDASK